MIEGVIPETLQELMDMVSGGAISPFRVGEAKEACKKLVKLAKEYEATFFSSETGISVVQGPCILCFRDIRYRALSHLHRRYGDSWYRKIIKLARVSPGIKFYQGCPSKPMVSGVRWRWVNCYSCDECLLWAAEEIRKVHFPRIQDKTDQQIEQERISEQASNTYWLSQAFLQSESKTVNRSGHYYLFNYDGSYLAALPYRDFLLTRYWKLVKSQVLKRSRYRCAVCSSRDTILDVHHKTYEHRGREIDWLDDLTVLCRGCHAKFHDKLPQPIADED